MAEESLIPKKFTTLRYSGEGFGVFFRISAILFLAAALLARGLSLSRNFLTNNLTRQRSVLEKLAIEFEPATILELERVSKTIFAGRGVLNNHTKISAIFDMLEANTMSSVSFGTFAYSAEKNTVTLSGEAGSYADVSAQSSVFEMLPDVESATFGNLALRESGAVGFVLNIVFRK